MTEDFTVKDCIIYKYLGKGGDVVILEGITGIHMHAFSWCNVLKSIKIPNSIKRIGEASFLRCQNLESMVIPDGVTDIGEFAFNGCKNLRNKNII
ncbi:MAG: leucine-rich repeat domain-containing protein [Clostridia bacterium]|nr:leucine-rich repeat domain-containing protein [Clostridia bacterium]